MIVVLLQFAVIWFIGHYLEIDKRVRLAAIGGLYLLVILLHLILPADSALRSATGGSAAPWLLLGVITGGVWFYRTGLGKLKARALEHEAATRPAPERTEQFSETELNRYARHIVLREIGGNGQKRLRDARVLVVGAGGLGSPALLYLAAAGVGTIGVIDDDTVENANLQRQIIHSDVNIGMAKVFSAQKAMTALNPYCEVFPYNRRLTDDVINDLVAEYDVVLDGTDNFATRYLVNATCVRLGVPLISGALTQWEGQISVFYPASGAPCYRCIFPQAPAPELAPACAEAGVLGPLPGVIGSMMAVECVKLITDAGTPLVGQMLIYDALYGENRKIGIKRRADCPDCGPRT
jgi:molybdopterin/thiamine biosynthesis adenylyltransferase